MTRKIEPERIPSERVPQSFQSLSIEEQERMRDGVAQACQPVAQSWPLKTFAYRNPLRGFEHLPFHTAVREAKHLLGGNGYLPNADYRQLYREGRISDEAIEQSIRRFEPGITTETITAGTRKIASMDVLRKHLLYGFDALSPALLEWQLSAGGATLRFRQDLPAAVRNRQTEDTSFLTALWNSVLSSLDLTNETINSSMTEDANPVVDLPAGRSLSDWLKTLADAPLVDQINDQMIKWCAAFLDEGMASWSMPSRGTGFYQAWRELSQRDYTGRFLGIKKFGKKVRGLPELPEDAIVLSLQRLGVPESRWTEYLSRLLTQLAGWAGFIRWRSENPDYESQKIHPMSPVQYLAVRLFYEVELVDVTCRREWGIDGTLPAVISHWENQRDEYQRRMQFDPDGTDDHTLAVCNDGWRLFHLAQFLELTPSDVSALPSSDVRSLIGWLDSFPSDRHGEVWLTALEASYQNDLISKLSAPADSPDDSPADTERSTFAQFVFCIDVRSEPMRRYLEANGRYETYGFAGFFGIPMRYQAFDSENLAALCPVILSPAFDVNEVPRSEEQDSLETYAASSRWNQLGEHLFHDMKRNAISSMMLIDVVGIFFASLLAGKTFFRRGYQSLLTRADDWFSRRIKTKIPVDPQQSSGDAAADSLPNGFTIAQQATFVESAMRAIGLTDDLGRFVVITGHGSTSDNNPYFAAYNCGACGGGHGDANARVFAAMANSSEVRAALDKNGLSIPDETWFLAAKHNTVTDSITFYDTQDIPASHSDDLRQLIADVEQASDLQAQTRGLVLPQTPENLSPEQAREHMMGRSVDWANVRPEWGLSSNAAFILGRRSLTDRVDLEGRVFLQSYDSECDPEGGILEALMTAPLVVAQWISMEYYFSAVDPWCYGSGSKVTHNVVSGIGVMHGAHGDLQSGLPLQSVNDGTSHYHKPVRLLAIVEAPTSRIESAIGKHQLLQHLVHNQWIHLVAVDPNSGGFQRYNPDATWAPLS